MRPRIKYGLIAGGVGLVINAVVAMAVGICGPFVALLVGAAAGFFTAQQEKPLSKGEGAKAGLISGAVAGGLVLAGQILGAIGALLLLQASGAQTLFGSAPSTSSDEPSQMIYYLSGVGVAMCFGLFGVLMSALSAAGVGYIATSEQTVIS